MIELMKEINTLGQEVNPNKLLLSSKILELAAKIQAGEEIPDEVFTSMHQDLRVATLTGLVMILMQGLQ